MLLDSLLGLICVEFRPKSCGCKIKGEKSIRNTMIGLRTTLDSSRTLSNIRNNAFINVEEIEGS